MHVLVFHYVVVDCCTAGWAWHAETIQKSSRIKEVWLPGTCLRARSFLTYM